MTFKSRSILLFLIFLGLAAGANAYVTSAILEYCAGDAVGFYLNGSELLERSEYGDSHYRILSSVDGTLPLELFKENEVNILGLKVSKTEDGGELTLSYRLTIHYSDREPFVLWSETQATKFIRLRKKEKSPEGWNELKFDDSTWMPVGKDVMKSGDLDWTPVQDIYPALGQGRATLPDKHFADMFGDGYVPYLVTMGSALDRILLRRSFVFPNQPAKPQITASPAKVSYGESVTLRLIPGSDAIDLSRFNLMAWLPEKVKLLDYARGGHFDSGERRISWKFSNRDMKADTLSLYAEKVVSASGWGAPEKFLGAPKEGKNERQFNIPDSVYADGAIITQGTAGWFKLEEPEMDFSQGLPVIQGVLFLTRLKLGASDSNGNLQKDRVYFNYSVNDQTKGLLKKDIELSKIANGTSWFDGYYDATEDRRWTWEDIKRLMVMFKARQIGQRDENRMSSITCVVKYASPGRVTPWLKVKVLEKDCAEISLQAGISHLGSKETRSEPVIIRVNESLCSPTASPTASQTPKFTPAPKATATALPTRAPTAMPTQGVKISLGLGCLTIAPDLVDEKGAFISFCLKTGCEVSVAIYNAETGTGKRRIMAAEFKAGSNNQIFFDGLDNHGELLQPGRYLCELRAKKGDHVETRNTYFRMALRKIKGE